MLNSLMNKFLRKKLAEVIDNKKVRFILLN